MRPDNPTLAARLRARERQVTVGGHVFTIRRPKPAELVQPLAGLDLVQRFTVGWDLTNADLVRGGTPDPEPFDAVLFRDYIEDEPALWEPLGEAIMGLWREHEAARADALKN